MSQTPTITAVHRSGTHDFSKPAQGSITLLEGLGVEGDAHCGTTVQHLYMIKKDNPLPNLRQVHLIQTELLDEVNAKGYDVKPGDLGENVSTRGLDVLTLPTGTRLHLGGEAIVEVTGLRAPCYQIDRFRKGLLAEMKEHRPEGGIAPKSGIMSIVIKGGVVRAGDAIGVELPAGEHIPLKAI